MAGRYKAYPEYKDSGVRLLGDIPSHWAVDKFRYLFSLGRGLGITKANLQDSGIPCVNYGEIHSKYGFEVSPDTHPLRCVSELYLESSPNSLLSNGDCIFADTSEDIEGAGNFTQLTSDQALFAGYHTVIARPKGENDVRFLAYVFDSPAYRTQIRLAVKGVKVFSITQEILKNTDLWLPPLPEQKQIAHFLDHETAKIDLLIAKQQALIALLKEKRQAVISHAVTKGLNPNAKMKDSGVEWLGQVPEHWEVKPLKYLMSLTSGGTPSKANLAYWDGTVPWASSKDLKSEELFDTQDHITQKALNDRAAELVPSGSILTVVRGMILQHTFPVVVARVPMAINQDLKSILPTSEVDADFLSWLLRGASDVVLSSTDEAGHGTKVLRMETWLAIQVPVPPLKEQAAIVTEVVKRLGQLDTLNADAGKAIELMQERRTALISAAVTGKIDVRDWEVKETEK
jgi:type I restriction enzyme S subunit